APRPPLPAARSLHDALPISATARRRAGWCRRSGPGRRAGAGRCASVVLSIRLGPTASPVGSRLSRPPRAIPPEGGGGAVEGRAQIGEHTSELQSPDHLVCRL